MDGETPRQRLSGEAAAEPLELIRQSELVARAGIDMLGAGTSGLRVRELMRAAASALGLDSFAAQVTFTDIVATVGKGGIYRTQVVEIGGPRVDAHRIALLQELSRDLSQPITADALEARLDAIEQAPRQYPGWLVALLVALACASVTVLSGGWGREVLVVLPAGALGYAARALLARWQGNHLASVLIAATLSCATYVTLAGLITLVVGEPAPRLAAGFICVAIFLIPGFPLVTGGLDVGRVDMGVGIPRIGYALTVLLAIAVGVWIVAVVSGISPDPVPPPDGAPGVLWAAWVAASFFAVFGWAVMFNSPWPVALASGAIGVIGNVPRLLLLESGVAVHIATFAACFLMGLACAAAGRVFDMEKIIMTVPTVLVAIPGSSALRTLLYFDRTDVVLAMENGVSTVIVVVAMVAGLAGARMLTDPEWAFARPDPPELKDSGVLSPRRFRRQTG